MSSWGRELRCGLRHVACLRATGGRARAGMNLRPEFGRGRLSTRTSRRPRRGLEPPELGPAEIDLKMSARYTSLREQQIVVHLLL